MRTTPGSAAQKLVRDKKKHFVREYKVASGCMDCGESRWQVLELDHRDPEEKNPILRASGTNANSKGRALLNLSWIDLKAEIAKCDVVCANCHRVRTAEQQGWE